MKVRPGTGIRGTRIDQAVRDWPCPGEQFLGGRRRRLHPLGHVFEQRAGWIIGDDDALPFRERLHLGGGRQIDVVEFRQCSRIGAEQVDPELLVDAGGQRVRAGQHEVDVDAARILLRLDLARELRRRRLGEGDARNEIGLCLAVIFDGLLRQREIARDIDDVERHRLLRQRQLREARAAEGRNACRTCNTADECPSGNRCLHGLPPVFCAT